MEGIPRSVRSYDETFDVVVVGYGFAGSIPALEASRAGARVLLIEKTGVPGGTGRGAVRRPRHGAAGCATVTSRPDARL